jgi:hypothetical protein
VKQVDDVALVHPHETAGQQLFEITDVVADGELVSIAIAKERGAAVCLKIDQFSQFYIMGALSIGHRDVVQIATFVWMW